MNLLRPPKTGGNPDTKKEKQSDMRKNLIKSSILAIGLSLLHFTCFSSYAAETKMVNGKKCVQHEIMRGETLSSISRNNKCAISDLKDVNPKLTENIRAGQKIWVPLAAEKTNESKPAASSTTASASKPAAPVSASNTETAIVEHTVKSGESLSVIAHKYNTTIADIKARNKGKIKGNDQVNIGTVLQICKNAALANNKPVADTKPVAENKPANNTKPAAEVKKTEVASATSPAESKPKAETTAKAETAKVESTKTAKDQPKANSFANGGILAVNSPKTNTENKTENASATTNYVKPASVNIETVKYVVKKGETLYSICQRQGCTLAEAQALNIGIAEKGIKEGDKINLPSRSAVIQRNKEGVTGVIVNKGETISSISRSLGISAKDLKQMNDLEDDNIRAGQLLNIPDAAKKKEKTGVASEYRKDQSAPSKSANVAHVVQPGETIFSLCKTYRVQEKDLFDANPDLKKQGLQAGRIVFIPRTSSAASMYVTTQGDNKVNVALILPFIPKDGVIDNNTDKFLEFYQGALLAIKQLKEQNIWVNLYAFDSGKTEADINKVLNKPELRGVDFIIGPAYKAQFGRLSEYCLLHNVKLVVPFSNRTEEVMSNPNMFLVNAPKTNEAEETALKMDSVVKGKKVIGLRFSGTDKNDKLDFYNTMIAELRKKGVSVTDTVFTTSEKLEAFLVSNGKEEKKKNKRVEGPTENIIITASTHQVSLTQMIPAINALNFTDKYSIGIFGYNEWLKHQAISNDLFVSDTYISTPFVIDFKKPETKAFIKNFRNYYGQEPNNTQPIYGALGYDIMLYFGTAVAKYGKNFEGGIMNEKMSVGTLQNNMKFKRFNNESGFYNAAISLTKNNGNEGQVVIAE